MSENGTFQSAQKQDFETVPAAGLAYVTCQKMVPFSTVFQCPQKLAYDGQFSDFRDIDWTVV